jgi:hypothetical protein
MRHEVAEPTTPEEWCATRCQEYEPTRYGLRRCDQQISRKCDACGKLVCSVHWRMDGIDPAAAELRDACWYPREMVRNAAFRQEWTAASAVRPARPKETKRQLLERIWRAWNRKSADGDEEE